jgi:hypothetical protein
MKQRAENGGESRPGAGVARGAQERPVWAVDSVESAPGAVAGARRGRELYIPLFVVSATRERKRLGF